MSFVQEKNPSSSDENLKNFIEMTKYMDYYFKTKKDKVDNFLESLDREKEKPQMTIMTCGHVDAGKSTLIGHLVHLLGQIDKKELHKLKNKNKVVNYSWFLDSSKIERNHGVTISVGMKVFETSERKFAILDCPGHKDFVPNLLSEASAADFALLIVDSTIGNFEKGFKEGGQTREHSMLVRSLGISRILVVLNKMDSVLSDGGEIKVRIDNCEQRYGEIKRRVSEFLTAAKFKFFSFVPISALNGQNLVEKDDFGGWYNGPSLASVLNSLEPPKRKVMDPPRVCISGSSSSYQHKNIAFGYVATGAIVVGEKLLIKPSNIPVTIKSILRYSEESEIAVSRDFVEVAFKGVNEEITPGSVVCSALAPVPVAKVFRAEIHTFKMDLPLIKGAQLKIYVHNEGAACLLDSIKETEGKNRPSNKKPKCVPGRTKATVFLRCEKAICIDSARNAKRLNRLILRRNGTTIAFGIIKKIIK